MNVCQAYLDDLLAHAYMRDGDTGNCRCGRLITFHPHRPQGSAGKK